MEKDHEQNIEIAIIKEQQKTMSQKIDDLSCLVKEEFSLLKKDLKDNYVEKNEFALVRTIVYGLVGTVLLTVLGVVLSKVVA